MTAASLAPASASASSVDQATAYQLDPAHDGDQTAPITTPLSQVWTFSLPALAYAGTVASQPLIVNGLVYTTVNGTLYAINQSTGTTTWSKTISSTYDELGIAYDAGQVFAVNFGGALTALNATTGATDWTTALPTQYEFEYPPVATGGYVYVNGGGESGTIYAVAESSGQIAWTAGDENGDGSPAVDATGVYWSEACGYNGAFAPFTGATLWSEQGDCDGGGGDTPVLAGGDVFARDYISGDFILSEGSGANLGTFSSTSAPAIGGGVAYTIVSGQLVAVSDSGLGTNAWTFSGDSHLFTAPLVVGDLIFVASSAGNVYAVNAADGSQAWTASAGTSITSGGDTGGIATGENTLLVPTSTELVEYAGANVGSGTPASMTAPSVVGTPVVGRPVGADVGVWTALPGSYTYQWSRCSGGTCTAISGATNESYTPISTDLGDTLEVTVTATNTSGTSTAVTSAASPSVVAPPASVTAPAISGSATVGSTLTATSGTWAQSPTTYGYQWERCSGGSCTAESDATSDTYVVQSGDVGSTIEVKVDASNGVGSTTATSQPTASVPVTPTTVSMSSSETTAKVGDTVTITAALSPAVNGGTFTFSENGAPVAGCASIAMSGSTVSCIGTAVSAGTVTIGGTYSGDSAYGPSSASLTLVITSATTTTTTTSTTSSAPKTTPQPVIPPSRTITRPGRSKKLPDFSLRIDAVRLDGSRYYWAVQNVSCYNRASAVDVTVNGHTIAVPCRRTLMLASGPVADHITYSIAFRAIEYGRRHKVVARGVVYRAAMYMPGPEAEWTAIHGSIPLA